MGEWMVLTPDNDSAHLVPHLQVVLFVPSCQEPCTLATLLKSAISCTAPRWKPSKQLNFHVVPQWTWNGGTNKEQFGNYSTHPHSFFSWIPHCKVLHVIAHSFSPRHRNIGAVMLYTPLHVFVQLGIFINVSDCRKDIGERCKWSLFQRVALQCRWLYGDCLDLLVQFYIIVDMWMCDVSDRNAEREGPGSPFYLGNHL